MPKLQKDDKKDERIDDFQYEIEKNQSQTPIRIFPFDPNMASETDWREMGITKRTARTIRNYLKKGGRFRQPADLAKIWGMRQTDIERLMPFVRINGRGNQIGTYGKPHADGTLTDRTSFKSKEKSLLDINRSDSSAWESLPGIGPGYARRIVRYRERLGGFLRVEQVAETFQLPDSVYQRIRPLLAPTRSDDIRTININQVSTDTLGRHPYCGFPMARLIIRFREQHGPYKRVDELLQIQRVDSVWWSRIRPYLRVE